MNDLIEYPALLSPATPLHQMELHSEDDVRLETLSHFGAPYCEGDTPLFI